MKKWWNLIPLSLLAVCAVACAPQKEFTPVRVIEDVNMQSSSDYYVATQAGTVQLVGSAGRGKARSEQFAALTGQTVCVSEFTGVIRPGECRGWRARR